MQGPNLHQKKAIRRTCSLLRQLHVLNECDDGQPFSPCIEFSVVLFICKPCLLKKIKTPFFL